MYLLVALGGRWPLQARQSATDGDDDLAASMACGKRVEAARGVLERQRLLDVDAQPAAVDLLTQRRQRLADGRCDDVCARDAPCRELLLVGHVQRARDLAAVAHHNGERD